MDRIVGELKRLTSPGRPLLIAIDGFGGSSKSTLAARLSTALASAFAINIDDFIVKEKFSDLSIDKSALDRHRLERQVLLSASRGEKIQYQQLI